jgi:hypothetical protein
MTTKRREVIALDYVKRFYAGFSHSISGFFSSEINVCNGSVGDSLAQFPGMAALGGLPDLDKAIPTPIWNESESPWLESQLSLTAIIQIG